MEGRGLGSRQAPDAARAGRVAMSLSPPWKVRTLQAALGAQAKGSPTYRFYALQDKLYRRDVLAYAYACCKANGGAAGVDGEAFPGIEAYGEERWLDELAETRHWVSSAFLR